VSSLVIPNAGEQSIITAYLSLVALGGGHTLRLYTNDPVTALTPDARDLLTSAAFTEATFPGYAAITVNSGWTYTQGNPTVALNTVRHFVRSSTGTPQTIRGYYLVEVTGGILAGYEHFDGPLVVEFLNDGVDVTPRIAIDDREGNDVEVGFIVPTGRAAAPTGWLMCDGGAVSRSTFANLFAAIGTAYGVGDGATTFNLPDLRQRFPLGKAASGTGATLGGTGGSIDHTHALDSATSHARIAMNDTTDQLSSEVKAVSNWTRNAGASLVTNNTGATDSIAARLGGNSDVANPPFQTVNYVIKT
jgi:microcystin-dependent protein